MIKILITMDFVSVEKRNFINVYSLDQLNKILNFYKDDETQIIDTRS